MYQLALSNMGFELSVSKDTARQDLVNLLIYISNECLYSHNDTISLIFRFEELIQMFSKPMQAFRRWMKGH